MQISDVNKFQATTPIRSQPDKTLASIGQTPTPESIETNDQASIGSVASAVSQGLAKSEARVAELRNQYQSGSYRVSAQELSSRLIDEHLSK